MPEPVPPLRGPRVTLRPWRLPGDLGPLRAINGDPVAMRFFARPLDAAESDAFATRMAAHDAAHGFAFRPVDLPGAGLVGVVGLIRVGFAAPFAPAVEIGWRLAPAWQRRGLAEEAARLWLAAGFGRLGLERVVAFTPPANEPSWRLMEKLGMRRIGAFDHPRLPEGHKLRPHLLYEARPGR